MAGKETVIKEYINVQLLGSGYAAVHMVLVKDDDGEYLDVQQTGIGRYKTKEEAEVEAKEWSISDKIFLDNNLK